MSSPQTAAEFSLLYLGHMEITNTTAVQLNIVVNQYKLQIVSETFISLAHL